MSNQEYKFQVGEMVCMKSDDRQQPEISKVVARGYQSLIPPKASWVQYCLEREEGDICIVSEEEIRTAEFADCLREIGRLGKEMTKEKADPQNDIINHPAHYTQGGIECIDAIRAAVTNCNGFEGYCVGNILKYVWRFKDKNGVQDLGKAGWYLKTLTEEVKK